MEGFAEAEGFGEVVSENYAWSREWTSTDYVGMLQTQSDHCMLPDGPRKALLRRVEQVIDAAGGSHNVKYVTSLLMARRVG